MLYSVLRDIMRVSLCSAQLKALFATLAAADSALAAHLRDIGAGECFFAYRMLVWWLACACHAALCTLGVRLSLIQGVMHGCAGAQVVLLRREVTQEEASAHPQCSLHASHLHLACICCMCTLMCVAP